MEILDMIKEWRKGCSNAGPMYDEMFPENAPTNPCECIACPEGLIDAIERKLLEEDK